MTKQRKSQLSQVLKTLDYCHTVFADACSCGHCGPCTTGRMRIGKAKKIVERYIANDHANVKLDAN